VHLNAGGGQEHPRRACALLHPAKQSTRAVTPPDHHAVGVVRRYAHLVGRVGLDGGEPRFPAVGQRLTGGRGPEGLAVAIGGATLPTLPTLRTLPVSAPAPSSRRRLSDSVRTSAK